ncbi:MAG: lamin tail domain-containing protein, partial [Anaerolineaceae bacterium]
MDDNLSDFINIGTGSPKNSSNPSTTCGYASLSILINEVAWAGTIASSDDEWIEFYNTGLTPIDLSLGWRLVADDGSPDITLTGTIGASDYFLLERGSGNATNVMENQTFTGSLGDIDEILRLRAPDGTVVDTANSDGGAWPAGISSPASSMERVGTVTDGNLSWSTFQGASSVLDAGGNAINGSPKGQNAMLNVTPTFTPSITPSPTNTFTPTSTLTFTPSITPTPAGLRSVIINEIAWAGTVSGLSNDEWIELYNPGNTPVDISGWSLSTGDGDPDIVIPLGISIPAGGYYLLERDDDNTVSDVAADQIYTGTLSNSGETLTLYDGSNKIIDTANGNGGGWPAGSSSTYGKIGR